MVCTRAHAPKGTHPFQHTCMLNATHTRTLSTYISHTSPHNLNTYKHTFPTLSEIYLPHTHRSKSRCKALCSHTLTHPCKHTPTTHTMHSFYNTPIQLMLLVIKIRYTPVSKPSHLENIQTSYSPTHPSYINTHSSTTPPQQTTAHILYLYLSLCLYVYLQSYLYLYLATHTYPVHTCTPSFSHVYAHTHLPWLYHAYIPYIFPRDRNSTVKTLPRAKRNPCLGSLKKYYLKFKIFMGE